MKRVISFLSSPKIFLITIFWLMILVVLGTLSQADIGLYESQLKYFSSWFLWLWYFPFPGGRLTLLVMIVNLFAFTLKPTFWSIKKIGIITIHCGVLLLLIGGGITAWFSKEGMMSIDEDKSSDFIFSPFNKELVIINSLDEDYNNVVAINDKLLTEGSLISGPQIPFTIEVLEYYINCTPILRDKPSLEYKGFAKRFSLLEIDNVKERELNYSGITFKISNSGDILVDGIYSLILEQEIPEIIKIQSNEYRLDLRRERTYLPFNLELVDFKKEMHPGTDIAKSFSSNINLRDNEIERSVLIEMNVPLRYKNYTFYQSAFRENSGYDTTILSVVKIASLSVGNSLYHFGTTEIAAATFCVLYLISGVLTRGGGSFVPQAPKKTTAETVASSLAFII